ncbi:MAG: cytidine deaminase [Paludibacteraceae bacterium]
MKERIIKAEIFECKYNELSLRYKQIVDIAKEKAGTAYAPYSKFYVGAAVLLENGKIIGGSNQENSASPDTLCAERVAMLYANAEYPDVAPQAIAVAAYTNGSFLPDPISPCGSCRQVLLESEVRYKKPIEVVLYGEERIYILKNIKQLLPLCFEKSSLRLDESKI